MTRGLRLLAPAKVNWTLEVLRVRPDGYHELRSVMQTLDLCDVVTLTPARDIELEIRGEGGHLASEAPETNLAYRAAAALRDRAGLREGVRIVLEKRIPVAAGLGGGSSDAGAVLRGCNALWDAGQDDTNLAEIAGDIGSDPPFFIYCGAAAISGRGDAVEPLDDAIAPPVLLAMPLAGGRAHKTASMFGALTPEHYSEGDATLGVRETIGAGREINADELMNVFERVTSTMQPETEKAMDALRAQGVSPHLAGAGPSFFVLLGGVLDADGLAECVRALGLEPLLSRALPRREALAIEAV